MTGLNVFELAGLNEDASSIEIQEKIEEIKKRSSRYKDKDSCKFFFLSLSAIIDSDNNLSLCLKDSNVSNELSFFKSLLSFFSESIVFFFLFKN